MDMEATWVVNKSLLNGRTGLLDNVDMFLVGILKFRPHQRHTRREYVAQFLAVARRRTLDVAALRCDGHRVGRRKLLGARRVAS